MLTAGDDHQQCATVRTVIRRTLTGLGVAVALTLTACGSTTHPSGNTLTCQHYRTQRAWVMGLATPTLTDGAKFAAWVALDAQRSTGQLHTDLAAMAADEQADRSSYAASSRVLADCQALGVKFST